jgi:hypothetical protein
VATDAAQFRVAFYRCGERLTFLGTSGWLPGQWAPHHLPFQDWGEPGLGLGDEALAPWPAHTFPIPEDWSSGVYVAMFVEGNGRGDVLERPDTITPDGRDAKALFVVKNGAPGRDASILYKLPLLTYHAYNQVGPRAYDAATRRGGWCLYTLPKPDDVPTPIPPTVSLRRPGGGTGGTPWDCHNTDPFDPTPRQTFVHWDAPFVAWLERTGYRVDYCTDVDVHDDEAALGAYALLLSVGHDEYWSEPMRRHVSRFVAAGGNVAFFSGNTCWFMVEFDAPWSFRRVAPWSRVGTPENSLTGVSFRNGGERDRNEHPVPVGYRVQCADHWVYAGTGLREGDSFGAEAGEYIVGYECDGAEFDRDEVARGIPAQPTGRDATPRDFAILGIADLRPSGWGLGNAAATMGTYTDNGTVFTAATTDWARVLAGGSSPAVERITRNVIDRLSGG